MRRPLEEMTKKEIMETILFIVDQILKHTSKFNQVTPSIFDKKEKEEKLNESKFSTDCTEEENDRNEKIPEKKIVEEEYSLNDLLYYWTEKLSFNENLLILMTMIFDKILNSKMILLNNKNVENILFTAMVITQKFYEDESFSDKDYSKLKKIDCDDLVDMQVEFLDCINYSLFIDEDNLQKYKLRMKTICEKNLLYLFNS